MVFYSRYHLKHSAHRPSSKICSYITATVQVGVETHAVDIAPRRAHIAPAVKLVHLEHVWPCASICARVFL